jgi:helicase
MGEWALASAIDAGLRGAYVAPLRAIVEERHTDWAKKFPQSKPGVFTGEAARTGGKVKPTDEKLLLFTPEKLGSFVQNWKRHLPWISELEVLVVDEFHLIGDPYRGAALESLLNRLQRINPFMRVVGLSATLANAPELASWMKARLFVSDWRPIPLEYSVRQFKRAGDKPGMLLEEVQKTLSEGGKVLTFVNSRRRTETIAAFLRSEGIEAQFSHAGRTRQERTEVHNAMRCGKIDVLVATSTVEMGVNFPARKVVIYDSYSFDGDSFSPLSIHRYLQFSGRAGRPGLDSKGESVLFAPAWDSNARKYLVGTPEPVRSGIFRTDALLREVLYEISTRLSISERHLEFNFAKRSLWRRQGGLHDVAPYVQHLVTAKLLRRVEKSDQTYLSHTALGRIATQMAVTPNTVGLFAALDQLQAPLSDFDLLLAACLSVEATPKLGFSFEDIDEIGDVVLAIHSHLLDLRWDDVQRLMRGLTVRSLLSAIKSAVILHRHSQLEPLETLAGLFDNYLADLITLRSNVGWVLAVGQRCFSALVERPMVPEGPQEGSTELEAPLAARCEAVRLMIEFGIPKPGLGLVKIARIGPRRAQMLCHAGICTIEELASLSTQHLCDTVSIGPRTAGVILASAKEHASEVSRARENATAVHVARRPVPARGAWPAAVDPYRLRRALELRVDHVSAEAVRVSGGTEPHLVSVQDVPMRQRVYTCDCADFAKGCRQCKHVLRARLALRDDGELRGALGQLKSTGRYPLRLSLGELWIQVGRTYDAFNGRTVDCTRPSAEGPQAAGLNGAYR